MLWLVILVVYQVPALAAGNPYTAEFGNDFDLTSFVTRPEIKAPLFNVEVFDEGALDAGYWFIGPYSWILQSQNPIYKNIYQPCQAGPHIYDQNGELVWSGACAFRNRVACDFRAFQANSTTFLSAIMLPSGNDLQGHGIVMDTSYNTILRLNAAPGVAVFNMHELVFVNEGSRALYIVSRPLYGSMAGLLQNGADSGWILDLGLHEVDLVTGEVTFEWWASNHIEVWESSHSARTDTTPNNAWDWLHTNSVTKNEEGDYLMSARNTNTIYKISGKDGQILWRFGGTKSTFDLVGFNFSRQHDSQWISYDEDVEHISFLDNGGDDTGYATSNTTTAYWIKLDKTTKPPRATVEHKISRPDGGKSELRGNLQNLPNGNAFVSWSDNSYFSEHAPDGRLLMQASYVSKRFVTYRAYKYPFEAFPEEEPRLHASSYSAGEMSLTVFHVSWNGATNVAVWKFWRVVDGEDQVIGETKRTGFETEYQSAHCEKEVYAEALGRDGESLGRTSVFTIESACTQRRKQVTGGKDHEALNEKDEL